MKTHKLASRLLLWTLTLGFTACAVGAPCDVGDQLVDGVCRAETQKPTSDGGTGVAASTFGSTCKDHPECTGEVNICLVPDGQVSGVCSVSGCDQKPSLCPQSWKCCDLARVRAGAPWGCVPLPSCP